MVFFFFHLSYVYVCLQAAFVFSSSPYLTLFLLYVCLSVLRFLEICARSLPVLL